MSVFEGVRMVSTVVWNELIQVYECRMSNLKLQ